MLNRCLDHGVIGNTTGFGSVILGSNPGHPTHDRWLLQPSVFCLWLQAVLRHSCHVLLDDGFQLFFELRVES